MAGFCLCAVFIIVYREIILHLFQTWLNVPAYSHGFLVPIVALYIAWLIGGVVIIEQVFNYPGIGTLMIQAVHDRDIPLVQAIVLVIAGAYVLLNMGADLVVMMLDPRLQSMRG